MSMIEPAGLSQVLSSISELSTKVGAGGVGLLAGDSTFADALVAASGGEQAQAGQTSPSGTTGPSGAAQTSPTGATGRLEATPPSAASTIAQPMQVTTRQSPSTYTEVPSSILLVSGGQAMMYHQAGGQPPAQGPSTGLSGADMAAAAAYPVSISSPGSSSVTYIGPPVTASDQAVPSGTGIMAAPAYLKPTFDEATAQYNLPPGLLEAVATQESGMSPNAVSSAGAEGIMQIMPGTAAANGISDPFDPTQAIFGAAKILAGNIAAFGSVPLALAAYNAGAGAVEHYGGIPPYAQTQGYVANIMAMMGGDA